MGPLERRERQRLALRKKILDTARSLFADEGYDAVTMRVIAHQIEYSPRTIYLHFKDKEELIRELCLEDYRSFGEQLGHLLEVKNPLERLKAIGQAYCVFAMTYPHHYQLMFMTPPPVSTTYAEVPFKGNPEADAYALLVDCVQQALAQGLLRPELEDPELIAQVAWSSLHGVVALAITHKDDWKLPWRPLEHRVELIIDLLGRGLARAPEPLKPWES